MNAALPYLSHRWFAPSLVVLCAVLGPWMPTDSPLTWGLAALLFVALGLPHGAVDHITYHHALGRNGTERSLAFCDALPHWDWRCSPRCSGGADCSHVGILGLGCVAFWAKPRRSAHP